MSSEADTCRIYVHPRLDAAGWNSEPHAYSEQNSFTDGRIIANRCTPVNALKQLRAATAAELGIRSNWCANCLCAIN